MQEFIETSCFDTFDLTPPERFEAWRDSISVVFDVCPHDQSKWRDNFVARLDSYLLDDIAINQARLGGQSFDRSSLRIAQDGLDHYQVHLFTKGHVEMECGRSDIKAVTGQWVVLDMAEPFKSGTIDYAVINIFIPRRRLAPLLKNPNGMHGLVFSDDIGAGRLLKDYVMSLNRAVNHIGLHQAPAAAEALVQLAALALNDVPIDMINPPPIADHALLLKAQNYIKANLADPFLSPVMIAEACGLSRTRLYRIFAQAGGVAAFIQEMRLRRAFGELVSARSQGYKIANVAFRTGFSNPSHFARLFKTRFGMTPQDARDAGTRAALDAATFTDLPVGDTKFAYWIANLG